MRPCFTSAFFWFLSVMGCSGAGARALLHEGSQGWSSQCFPARLNLEHGIPRAGCAGGRQWSQHSEAIPKLAGLSQEGMFPKSSGKLVILFLSGEQPADTKHFAAMGILGCRNMCYLLLAVDRHVFILKACAGPYPEDTAVGRPRCAVPHKCTEGCSVLNSL